MPHPKSIEKIIRSTLPKKNTFRIALNDSDPSLKGLSLEVSSSGNKLYVLAYTSPVSKKRRFLKLGLCSSTSPQEAMKLARSAREKIFDGICPASEKQLLKQKKTQEEEEEQQKNRQGTVAQLFEYYLKDLDMDSKKSFDQVKNIYQRDIELPIGSLIANTVTDDQLADIIATIAERGANRLANITRSYLHAAFEFGMSCNKSPRWRLNQDIPLFNLIINPAKNTKKTKNGDKAGEHFIAKEDINTLWTSIGVTAMSPDCALAIKFLISTGVRVTEVLEAPWSEFNEKDLLWSIPAERRKHTQSSKKAKPLLVPLTPFHINLLHEIKKLSGKSSFLFPSQKSPSTPRTIDSLNQAVARFCKPQGSSKRSPFTKFTPRDIRRTWKTIAGSLKIDLELRNRIQGHAFTDVGSVNYDRYEYLDEKREGMEVWIDWLSNEVKPKSS